MNLTEEEAATYDRQIRLWGLDAQKRLRAAKICVLGVFGLGSEVCKNLVLAGIKSLCIVDHRTVGKECIGAQFLVRAEEEGKNVAEASAPRLQLLNPNVLITTKACVPDELPDEFFKDFDVVCVLGIAAKTSWLNRINPICHKENIKFYCGEVFGFHGYFFADLGEEYSFVVEDTKGKGSVAVDDKEGNSSEPSAKRSKVEDDANGDDANGDDANGDGSVKMVKQTLSFASWENASCADWSKNASARLLRRTSPVFFLMLILQRFFDRHGRCPASASADEDQSTLKEFRDDVLKELEIQNDVVSLDLLQECLAELSPACAVVGGVLAQEVIKAVSGKDAPLNNFFFYHGMQGNGIVEKLGYK